MTRRVGRRAAPALLAVVGFCGVTVEFLPVASLSAIATDLGVDDGAATLLVSSFAAALAALTVPAAHLTRGLPPARLLLLGAVLLGVSTAALALAPSLAVAVALRITGGVGLGLIWSAQASILSSWWSGARLARAMTVTAGGISLAFVAGLPLLTLASQFVSWRAGAAVAGAVVIVVAVIAVLLLPPVPEGRGSEPVDSATGRPDARALTTVLAIVCVMAAQYAVFTVVEATVRIDPALFLFVFGLGGCLGLVVAHVSSARHHLAMLVGTLALLGSVLIAGFDASTIASAAAWGTAFGMLPPLLNARALSAATAASRRMTAALTAASFQVGIMGGATIAALTAHHTAGVIGAVLCACALLLLRRR